MGKRGGRGGGEKTERGERGDGEGREEGPGIRARNTVLILVLKVRRRVLFWGPKGSSPETAAPSYMNHKTRKGCGISAPPRASFSSVFDPVALLLIYVGHMIHLAFDAHSTKAQSQ